MLHTPGCSAPRATQKWHRAQLAAGAGLRERDAQPEKTPGQTAERKLRPIVAGDTTRAQDRSQREATQTATWSRTNHDKEPCATRATFPRAQSNAQSGPAPGALYPVCP